MTVLLIFETCVIVLFLYLLFKAGRNATEMQNEIRGLHQKIADQLNENNFFRKENRELQGQIQGSVRALDEAEIALNNAKAVIKEHERLINDLKKKNKRTTLKGKK